MVFYGQAVGSHFVATRRSPLESVVVKTNEEEEEQGGRSLFLRGWLTEAETAEVAIFPHVLVITNQQPGVGTL